MFNAFRMFVLKKSEKPPDWRGFTLIVVSFSKNVEFVAYS